MPVITLTFPFAPVPKGRPRFGRGFTYTPMKTRRFESDVKIWARKYVKNPMKGPLKITTTFFLKAPKKKTMEYPVKVPDWDNLAKGITDPLNGIAWIDDAQIIEAKVSKFYDMTGGPGRIVVLVEEMKA